MKFRFSLNLGVIVTSFLLLISPAFAQATEDDQFSIDGMMRLVRENVDADLVSSVILIIVIVLVGVSMFTLMHVARRRSVQKKKEFLQGRRKSAERKERKKANLSSLGLGMNPSTMRDEEEEEEEDDDLEEDEESVTNKKSFSDKAGRDEEEANSGGGFLSRLFKKKKAAEEDSDLPKKQSPSRNQSSLKNRLSFRKKTSEPEVRSQMRNEKSALSQRMQRVLVVADDADDMLYHDKKSALSEDYGARSSNWENEVERRNPSSARDVRSADLELYRKEEKGDRTSFVGRGAENRNIGSKWHDAEEEEASPPITRLRDRHIQDREETRPESTRSLRKKVSADKESRRVSPGTEKKEGGLLNRALNVVRDKAGESGISFNRSKETVHDTFSGSRLSQRLNRVIPDISDDFEPIRKKSNIVFEDRNEDVLEDAFVETEDGWESDHAESFQEQPSFDASGAKVAENDSLDSDEQNSGKGWDDYDEEEPEPELESYNESEPENYDESESELGVARKDLREDRQQRDPFENYTRNKKRSTSSAGAGSPLAYEPAAPERWDTGVDPEHFKDTTGVRPESNQEIIPSRASREKSKSHRRLQQVIDFYANPQPKREKHADDSSEESGT